MWLLLDIGNTHTHLGLCTVDRVFRQKNIPTSSWFDGTAPELLIQFVGKRFLYGVTMCSVVPRATPLAVRLAKSIFMKTALVMTPETLRWVGINYPKPETIGPD